MTQSLLKFLESKGINVYIQHVKILRDFINKKKKYYFRLTLFLFIMAITEILVSVYLILGDGKTNFEKIFVTLSSTSVLALLLTFFMTFASLFKYLTYSRSDDLLYKFLHELLDKKDAKEIVTISKIYITKFSKELNIPRTQILKRLIIKNRMEEI